MENISYVELFKARKWKDAFAAMPLNSPKPVVLESPKDIFILRTRASEFTRESDRVVSVSIDFDSNSAIVTVKKK